jgi:hypothetical protein
LAYLQPNKKMTAPPGIDRYAALDRRVSSRSAGKDRPACTGEQRVDKTGRRFCRERRWGGPKHRDAAMDLFVVPTIGFDR